MRRYLFEIPRTHPLTLPPERDRLSLLRKEGELIHFQAFTPLFASAERGDRGVSSCELTGGQGGEFV